MKLEERIINIARIFKIREGFTKEDDIVHDRFCEPYTSSALSETEIEKQKFQDALEN